MTQEEGNERFSVAQRVGLVLGLAVFVAILLGWGDEGAGRMAAVAALMAVWWLTEALPLFVTALTPLVLFPLLGIMSGRATAPLYVNSTIFLFIGGFLISLTMERWQLHTRLALTIIRGIGGGPRRMVLGFMIAAAFLSMWVSNTATAIMMVPIGLAIVTHLEAEHGRERVRPFTVALMLGIAYACSVGGMATLVGTPPNLAFRRIFEITFPQAESVAFGAWMAMALPISALMLGAMWLLLTRVFCRIESGITPKGEVIRDRLRALGRITFEQRAVLLVFTMTAAAWVFRQPLEIGGLRIPGWGPLLPYPELVDDGTVALFMALLLFVIPSRSPAGPGPTLAGPSLLAKVPWDIVLLFGGGFALAQGFQDSGLSNLIGEAVGRAGSLAPLPMVASVCTGLTFLTEVTSNTATTQMILPILAALALEFQVHPLLLMIPATLSASCAFMMPVATPPNAIVFGSGRLRIWDMARVGLFFNLLGVVVITGLFLLLGAGVLGVEAGTVPDWAVPG